MEYLKRFCLTPTDDLSLLKEGRTQKLNGKVIFKFRCYKVEEIECAIDYDHECGRDCTYHTDSTCQEVLGECSCLYNDIDEYLDWKPDNIVAYAIHIGKVEIFDRPQELRSFNKLGSKEKHEKALKYAMKEDCKISERIHNGVARDNEVANCVELEEASYYMGAYGLTKAPKNFCYVEVE